MTTTPASPHPTSSTSTTVTTPPPRHPAQDLCLDVCDAVGHTLDPTAFHQHLTRHGYPEADAREAASAIQGFLTWHRIHYPLHRADEPSTTELAVFLDDRTSDPSQRTRYHQALHTLFAWLRPGHANPADPIDPQEPMPRRAGHTRTDLLAGAQHAWWQTLSSHTPDPTGRLIAARDHTMLALLADTQLTLDEACHLQLILANPHHRHVLVDSRPRLRSGSLDDEPLTERANATLHRYLVATHPQLPGNGLLFPNITANSPDTPLDPSQVSSQLDAYAEPHDSSKPA